MLRVTFPVHVLHAHVAVVLLHLCHAIRKKIRLRKQAKTAPHRSRSALAFGVSTLRKVDNPKKDKEEKEQTVDGQKTSNF